MVAVAGRMSCCDGGPALVTRHKSSAGAYGLPGGASRRRAAAALASVASIFVTFFALFDLAQGYAFACRGGFLKSRSAQGDYAR